MHMQIDINTKVEINTLEDLPKLNLLMESCNMKVNKSQLARDLNIDRQTIILNGRNPNDDILIEFGDQLLKHVKELKQLKD